MNIFFGSGFTRFTETLPALQASQQADGSKHMWLWLSKPFWDPILGKVHHPFRNLLQWLDLDLHRGLTDLDVEKPMAMCDPEESWLDSWLPSGPRGPLFLRRRCVSSISWRRQAQVLPASTPVENPLASDSMGD